MCMYVCAGAVNRIVAFILAHVVLARVKIGNAPRESTLASVTFLSIPYPVYVCMYVWVCVCMCVGGRSEHMMITSGNCMNSLLLLVWCDICQKVFEPEAGGSRMSSVLTMMSAEALNLFAFNAFVRKEHSPLRTTTTFLS